MYYILSISYGFREVVFASNDVKAVRKKYSELRSNPDVYFVITKIVDINTLYLN